MMNAQMTLHPQSASTIHADVEEWPSFEPNTICVAEDDPASRRLVEHMLARAGHSVVFAHDGTAVLDVVRQRRPAIFLLDCNMPEMDGFETCAKLREDPRFTETPIIFFTALTDAASKARGFEVGGSDYVCKPPERVELLARVRTHLELARKREADRRRSMMLQNLVDSQGERLDEVRAGQACLLTDASQFAGLEVGLQFAPAHEAGGDFYEIADLSDDESGMLVADVSGHDLSVPFVTGALKALAVTWMNETLGTHDTLSMLNVSLGKFLSIERFVTAVYAKFNHTSQTLEIASAGHPPAVLQRKGEPPQFIELSGHVLAMFDAPKFDVAQIAVNRGDRLYLYTDGLVEGHMAAAGPHSTLDQSNQWLLDAIDQTADIAVEQAADNLMRQLNELSVNGLQDDVVIMGVQF
jgi:sigma-B regulation protein RsbU (phosphoserine phosphatase)